MFLGAALEARESSTVRRRRLRGVGWTPQGTRAEPRVTHAFRAGRFPLRFSSVSAGEADHGIGRGSLRLDPRSCLGLPSLGNYLLG